MNMAEILEGDKQRVLSELSGEKSPAETSQVVVKVLDRVLIRYNTEEPSALKRANASRMVESAKALAPAIDSIGGTKVWERADGQTKTQKKGIGFFPVLFFLLGILGVLAGSFLWIYQTGGKEDFLKTFSASWWLYLLPVIGGLLQLLAGRMAGKKRVEEVKKEQKVEVYCDADKVYRILHAVTLIIDRELKAVEEGSDAAPDGEEQKVLTKAELQLYSDILEAAYASEEEAIRECMEDLRFYLHKQGIEVMDYSEKNAAWFEKMPGATPETVRPALVSDGVLLQRGLAAGV